MVVSLNMQNTEIGWHGGWMWCWQFVRDDNNKFVSECGRDRGSWDSYRIRVVLLVQKELMQTILIIIPR